MHSYLELKDTVHTVMTMLQKIEMYQKILKWFCLAEFCCKPLKANRFINCFFWYDIQVAVELNN